MKNTDLASLYAPTHDERSRQAFVGALKAQVNGPLEGDLERLYDSMIRPAHIAKAGRAPEKRDDVIPAFENQPLYQLWGSLVFTSQDLMWETVGDTVDRVRPAFERRARELAALGKPRGSLTLAPDLQIPKPIADVDIHRQPGGYFYEASGDDLTTALLYMGAVELYRSAKGLGTGAKPGEPGKGRLIAQHVAQQYPDLKPRRILDLGCANGIETLAYKQQWPDAEVHGIDLSAPLLRFAHVWAEDRGLAVHYHQMNAAKLDFPDGHFDLIVSHILFHETWFDLHDQIMREANRVLAPGGVFLNGDVPYQPSVLPMTKQVTNAWQVAHNGEPYWTGFADRDVKEDLLKAGFKREGVFADYVPMGQGVYYYFGGRK